MGLLNSGGVFGNLPFLGKKGADKNSSGFRDTLKYSDFAAANVTLVADKWNDLGSYQVGFQQQVNIGYGSASTPQEAGYIYTKLIDLGTGTIAGKFRVFITDANDVGKVVAFNEDLARLAGDLTDKNKLIMLPRIDNVNGVDATAYQNDKIYLQVYAVANTVWDYDSASGAIYIPITRKFAVK